MCNIHILTNIQKDYSLRQYIHGNPNVIICIASKKDIVGLENYKYTYQRWVYTLLKEKYCWTTGKTKLKPRKGMGWRGKTTRKSEENGETDGPIEYQHVLLVAKPSQPLKVAIFGVKDHLAAIEKIASESSWSRSAKVDRCCSSCPLF